MLTSKNFNNIGYQKHITKNHPNICKNANGQLCPPLEDPWIITPLAKYVGLAVLNWELCAIDRGLSASWARYLPSRVDFAFSPNPIVRVGNLWCWYLFQVMHFVLCNFFKMVRKPIKSTVYVTSLYLYCCLKIISIFVVTFHIRTILPFTTIYT